MAESIEQLSERLDEKLGSRLQNRSIANGQLTLEIPAEHLLPVCTVLRDDPDFEFEQLIDVCGMDYSAWGQTDWQTQSATTSGFSRGVTEFSNSRAGSDKMALAVVYHLLSLKYNRRLRLRVFVEKEPPVIDSVIDIWASANWFEREAFDLFGIIFEGHPDLRRLLTDYGFIGHPFRKDFPLEGNVEVRYDPEQGRVVYQPVSIEPRVLVPRVIREDHRYFDNLSDEDLPDA